MVRELTTFASPGCVGGCGSGNGDIREFATFGNTVPTGLEVRGRKVYQAEAGPIPHRPETGKIIRLTRGTAAPIASGASLIVDVESGRNGQLYALSQGTWDLPPTPENEGKPASPGTGRLLRVDDNGGFTTIVESLDRPTSLELVGDHGYVITITGKVVKIDNLGQGPCGQQNSRLR